MPVYNGGVALPAAIECILNQDVPDLELIISDNASTDVTQAVCERYAALDSRVTYTRHSLNRGAVANFLFVFERGKAPYFMWHAVDDLISLDFIRLNRAFLAANPEYIASTSPSHFSGGEQSPTQMGDGLLDEESFRARVMLFLSEWHANSAFYSLFRASALRKAIQPFNGYLGIDWSVMLRLAALGRAKRLEHGWIERSPNGISSDLSSLTTSRSRGIHWLLPFYDMSKVAVSLLGDSGWRCQRDLLRRLARLNWDAARTQAKYELKKRLSRLVGATNALRSD